MKKKYRVAALAVMLGVILTGCSPDGIPSFRAMMLGEPEMIEFPYDPLDYVTLGQYKSIEIDMEREIQNQLDYIIGVSEENIVRSDAKEVKKGDMVNINYSGEIGGEKFDGGSEDAVSLRLGSGSKFDAFEDALIGFKVGEEKKINLTFPEDYNETEYAGKDVVFTVKVNYVYKEADDAIVEKATNSEYKTVKELKKQIEAYIEQNLGGQALRKVMEDSKFEKLPDEQVETMKNMLEKGLEQTAQPYGMDVATYLMQRYGETEQSYYEYFAKERLLVEAVVKEEGYRVTKEMYQEQLDQLLKKNNMDEKTYREYFKQSVSDKISVEEYMVYTMKYEFYCDLVVNSAKKK